MQVIEGKRQEGREGSVELAAVGEGLLFARGPWVCSVGERRRLDGRIGQCWCGLRTVGTVVDRGVGCGLWDGCARWMWVPSSQGLGSKQEADREAPVGPLGGC